MEGVLPMKDSVETVSQGVIEQLMKLTDELPEQQKEELLRLVGRWDTLGGRARRTVYSDQIPFVSASGVHYGYARNLSRSGIFIESDDTFNTGDKLIVTLVLLGTAASIEVLGEVKRIAKDGIAVRFYFQSEIEESKLTVAIVKRYQMLNIIDKKR